MQNEIIWLFWPFWSVLLECLVQRLLVGGWAMPNGILSKELGPCKLSFHSPHCIFKITIKPSGQFKTTIKTIIKTKQTNITTAIATMKLNVQGTMDQWIVFGFTSVKNQNSTFEVYLFVLERFLSVQKKCEVHCCVLKWSYTVVSNMF